MKTVNVNDMIEENKTANHCTKVRTTKTAKNTTTKLIYDAKRFGDVLFGFKWKRWYTF